MAMEATASRLRPALHGVLVRIGAKPKVPGERGLPKPERLEARLTRSGVEGDYNVYRETVKQGSPEMAILLMPQETLAQLNREGWPVRPGDLGENLTTSGLPYEAFAPPCHLTVGPVEMEVTKPCAPCDNLYQLPYIGPSRGPEFVRTLLKRRGWYARVVRDGTVRRGDPMTLVAGR